MFICKEDQHEWRHKEIFKGVGIKRCCICWVWKFYDMKTEKFENWNHKEAMEKYKE